MTNTSTKFLEAKYFLNRLIEFQTDRTPFKYNLSAFLAAFRSVTLFMQKEYSGVENFATWYETVRIELESNTKMKLLNKNRVTTIHKVPIEPKAQIHVSIHESLTLTDEVTIEIIHADGTIEKEEPVISESSETPKEIKIEDKWLWYFDNYNDSDVITICNDCIISLEKIITECELKFKLS